MDFLRAVSQLLYIGNNSNSYCEKTWIEMNIQHTTHDPFDSIFYALPHTFTGSTNLDTILSKRSSEHPGNRSVVMWLMCWLSLKEKNSHQIRAQRKAAAFAPRRLIRLLIAVKCHLSPVRTRANEGRGHSQSGSSGPQSRFLQAREQSEW